VIRNKYIETVVERPPEGWTLGHVTLHLHNPDERIPVEAWRRGAFAIHERMDYDGKTAVLSHAPTGLCVNNFASMDDAAECAERLEPLTDWAAISERFEAGSDLYPKVRGIVEAIKDRSRADVGTGKQP
jgi:hypothetical protein